MSVSFVPFSLAHPVFYYKEGGLQQASSSHCCWLRRATGQTTGPNDTGLLQTCLKWGMHGL